jgi:hypothetical protein
MSGWLFYTLLSRDGRFPAKKDSVGYRKETYQRDIELYPCMKEKLKNSNSGSEKERKRKKGYHITRLLPTLNQGKSII